MKNSNSKNEKISEKEKIYFALRDEVRDNQRQENTMIIFSYTVVATLLGFAFKDNKWAAIIAMMFIIPVSYRIGRFRDSIAYLSTYMSIFLEPYLNFSWENDHFEYRKNDNTSKSFLFMVSRFDFLILGLLSLTSVATFWKLNGFTKIHNSCVWTLLTSVVQILMLILIIISTTKYSNVDKLKKNKLEKWNEFCPNNNSKDLTNQNNQ